MLFFNEDDALYQLLQGMTVSDGGSPSQSPVAWGTREVGVFFSMPDKQVRDAAYPFVTLDLIGIREAVDRTMRGKLVINHGDPWLLEGMSDPTDGGAYIMDRATPVDMTYQVTAYSRQPQHDRQILSQLLVERLPFHFGQVATLADKRLRRITLQEVRSADMVEGGKRLYRKILTIQVVSQIENDMPTFAPLANTVNIISGGKIPHDIPFTPGVDPTFILDIASGKNNTWKWELTQGTWADALTYNLTWGGTDIG